MPPDREFDPINLGYRNEPLKQVPLIQIFGKAIEDHSDQCIIVHGMFAKIYVDCPQDENEQNQFRDAILHHISTKFPEQIVYDFKTVTSTSIYGYNMPQRFLQISLISLNLQQISYHLSTFVWGGKAIKSYEGHIPYFLQFFRDYNLTGCGKINLSNFKILESKISKYGTEIHCTVNDIISPKVNSSSQILSHLEPIWKEQKEIRRNMNIDTEPAITFTSRRDLLFTQRLPQIEPSQIPPTSQELENLLEYLEKYDPNKSLESIENEEQRTQLEVDSILSEGPIFHCPSTFDVRPLTCTLSDLTSQVTTIDTFATKLIVQENKSFFKYTKETFNQNEEEELNEEQPEEDTQEENHSSENISILFLEIGCKPRPNLLPDPEHDPIIFIIYSFYLNDKILETGVIYNGPKFQYPIQCMYVNDEPTLFSKLINLILRLNPDIIVGFNTEKESIGYINERSIYLGITNFYDEISRVKKHFTSFEDVRNIGGRIIFNVWRIIRGIERLRIYTITNISDKILGIPFPEITNEQILTWLEITPYKYIFFIYNKMNIVLSLIRKLNLIPYICELTQVFGIDICSTLTRGSQFHTESLLCRVSKRMNYLLYTPTRKEMMSQRAPMSIPLVMEPKSGFYSNPVMVIDFQSLYPSTIIGYNLCYSTILGRVENIKKGFGQIGCVENYQIDMKKVNEMINNSDVINTPNDVLFVKKNVRKGIFPIMLEQILNLRSYIKDTIKNTKNVKLLSVLDSRQKALKSFAACIYGYTSAHYSGRMPCVELGDSIVECSRHLIEFVLNYIEKNYENLTVLYGDTDSLFIMMPNSSKEKCFKFAENLCKEISSFFPSPIKIKLEKIYYGVFLVNKKRYCGWMYENVHQNKLTFDVKGLEIKRRDSCLLVSKVMTDVLELIQKYHNIDIAKDKFIEYINGICNNSIPLGDYIFAKEIRPGTYKVKPPVAYVSETLEKSDPRKKPIYGERIQYVIVSSAPKSKLIERVVSVNEYLEKNLRIDINYYILKQIIPSLGRVLETIGVDVNQWIKNININLYKIPYYPFKKNYKQITILERYCKQVICPLCEKECKNNKISRFCNSCLNNGGKKECIFELVKRVKLFERQYFECLEKCSKCANIDGIDKDAFCCYSCDNYWKCALAKEKMDTYQSYLEINE